MKNTIVASVILTGIAWFAVARLGGAKTDDEVAIRALEDQRAKAARARDIEGVMAVYAPDVFVFDFIPPRQKVGANAYRENWTSFFVTPLTYEVKDLSVTVVGDLAYSHWINHYGTTYEGKPLEGNNRVTDVYRKTKGKWLIVQEHVSVPVDLDSGKADLASKP